MKNLNTILKVNQNITFDNNKTILKITAQNVMDYNNYTADIQKVAMQPYSKKLAKMYTQKKGYLNLKICWQKWLNFIHVCYTVH